MFRSWASNTFESLSNPQFRVLWAGTLFSTLAYMMMFVVQNIMKNIILVPSLKFKTILKNMIQLH